MGKTIFIPDVGKAFILSEDWQVELPWYEYNLRMLAAFKLTGTKRTEVGYTYLRDSGGNYLRDSQGKYKTEPKYMNITVPNPIFRDYEGNSTPALVTFPKGTEFTITRLNAGSRGVDLIHLKCTASDRKGLKTKCMRLTPEGINGCPIE